MKLSLKVAKELNKEKSFLMNHKIKLKICGDHDLIPEEVYNAF